MPKNGAFHENNNGPLARLRCMDRDRIRAGLGPDVISVVSRSGAVTLDGTVVDAAQIDKLAEIARGVPGVTSAANRLTVRKPFGRQ